MIRSVAPAPEAVNVHGGASRNVDGVPELGMQNGPAGSAGSHPVAGVPASVNPNSSHSSNGIGPANAGALNSALDGQGKSQPT